MALLSLPCSRRRWLAAGALLCVARAFAQSPLERDVKAAYLYKFAGYIQWPAGTWETPDAPLVLGVAGDPQLAAALERTVAGRRLGTHPCQVRQVRRGEALDGLKILFIGRGEPAPELLAALRGQAVLTVTDSPEAFAHGSMINFVVTDERLRFDVALPAVSASRLRISARMLSVANRVLGAS
jgi:hypothetical protein